MPDVPPAPDEAATLRAANARLREVIEAKAAGAAVLRAQLEACQAQLEELRAEVEALRARVRRNPRNSSRPPSSKGLAKPALRSLRRRSGRKPGRPKGQPGATLEMTDRPDEVVWHEPGRCAGCGAGLSGAPLARTHAGKRRPRPLNRPADTGARREQAADPDATYPAGLATSLSTPKLCPRTASRAWSVQLPLSSSGLTSMRQARTRLLFLLGSTKIPIPRHTEIGERTIEDIFHECQDELGKGWWRT